MRRSLVSNIVPAAVHVIWGTEADSSGSASPSVDPRAFPEAGSTIGSSSLSPRRPTQFSYPHPYSHPGPITIISLKKDLQSSHHLHRILAMTSIFQVGLLILDV